MAAQILYTGGAGTVGGIASDDLYYTENPTFRYGTSTHNCGGRCIIRAQVTPDGRIVRFLTDETKYAYDGTSIDNNHPNTTQARACARCRAYKGRLYHPGRLKYPLKQTKERGDISGFQRITWEQALSEIAARLKAVQGKYGAEAFHPIYACGNIASSFQGGSYTGLFEVNDFGTISPALRLLGGASGYTSDYSFHQGSYMGGYGTAYSGMINMSPSPEFLDRKMHFVMWGSNIPTTHNPKAFSWTKGIENMKNHGGTVKFIGPELSEIGIAQANEWIRIKPYTDVALILGMLYHMLDLTFDENGNINQDGLDVNYLDKMVYGFFETPEYWRNKTTGEISFDNKSADTNYIYVAAIPAGQSFSAYIMGDDARLTKAKYSASQNYMAQQFASKVDKRNTSVAKFSFANIQNTKYDYKKQMNVKKTPKWAEKITGVPEAKIKELAEFYLKCAKDKVPVYNEWAGGQLKQNDGTITLYALQALLIISKNWGITGTGIANNAIGVSKTTDPNQITASLLRPAAWDDGTIAKMGPHPKISVTQWHNAIKMAFSKELAANGYKPNIPDWVKASGKGKPKYIAGKKGQVYFDDGGVKSLVNRQGITGVGKDSPATFTVNNIEVTMPDGTKRSVTHEYYDFKDNKVSTGGTLVDQTDNVTFSGFRFILNSAGNIPINQHANPIDSARMYKALPTYGYGPYPTGNMADAFYLVTFDNFMSPSARYSDYVLPAKTTWEQEDFVTIENSGTLYVDSVIPGPGESKSSWDFVRELIYHYGGKDSAVNFTGLQSNSSFRDVVQKQYNENIKTNAQSPYYGKTWDEFIKKPISHAKPKTERVDMVTHSTRTAYESKGAMDAFYPNVTTADWSNDSGVFGFGNDLYDTKIHSFAETESCSKQTGMFQVYSGTLVWRYENLFSKWHGYLPKAKQGQINKDEEGDPVAYPIPVYFNYQDHFRVAYGLNSNDDLKGRYLLTTTHDRFRAHSSQAENPYLRELTHRTIGGALYSGNDSGTYAVSNGDDVSFPALNSLIGEDGKPVAGAEQRASYADIWVNDEDFADYNDGDLVKVSNEIGAVYCTIRKTARCVPGYVGLHQGCWYDPREINGETVDVGGNCNTLMPSTPSRLDHGNGVQSAMVKIERV